MAGRDILSEKQKIISIVGPTASGKTRLAVELAKIFDGEVISADSMQIYQGMKIATAKPDKTEMQGIPHHLMDFLPPDKSYVSRIFPREGSSRYWRAVRAYTSILCSGISNSAKRNATKS